jgi:UDP-MurNAc hydroxylase
MLIESLGHAGLRVRTASGILLMDPWFSPEGAFQASWFQFPDNQYLATPDVFEVDAIVISHEHLDHTDPWVLSRVPSRVPVFIPQYPSPALRHKIESLGSRQVVEVAPWKVAEPVDGIRLFFVSEPSPMNHDSAIVLQADGQSLLNLNDARLSPVQFREICQAVGGKVDLFTFQGAGASWYPMVYDYPSEWSHEMSHRKRMAKLMYCARAMSTVSPVVGAPFAGPPCFLDPELMMLNAEMRTGIFPDQRQVAEWLVSRGINNVVVLLPGEAWDADSRMAVRDDRWGGFWELDRDAYLSSYAERRQPHLDSVLARHPHPNESLWPAFRDYFQTLLSFSPYFNGRIAMRVGFDVTGPGGGRWAVDFRPGQEEVSPQQGECQYVYRFASRWLSPILDGRVPWEDFFLSCRFSAWREPDIYNDHLLGLLKFADREALRRVEAYETSRKREEHITIHADDRVYRVERYCPHAGNDLQQTGEVLPGRVLRCLAHHYEFDLDTGRCLNGTYGPLDVEMLEGEDSSRR